MRLPLALSALLVTVPYSTSFAQIEPVPRYATPLEHSALLEKNQLTIAEFSTFEQARFSTLTARGKLAHCGVYAVAISTKSGLYGWRIAVYSRRDDEALLERQLFAASEEHFDQLVFQDGLLRTRQAGVDTTALQYRMRCL